MNYAYWQLTVAVQDAYRTWHKQPSERHLRQYQALTDLYRVAFLS